MTGRILGITHTRHSNPGRTRALLRERGLDLECRCLAKGEQLPSSLDDHDGVIVFGGPMSVNDDHPSIKAELAWLPRALDSGKPVLGICLGGQMLSAALGADVGPHPRGVTEIGYSEIRPTEAGRDYFPDRFTVYQWHQDAMGLPDGAVRLATSDLFDTQAYRWGDQAYAIQFHPEVTRDMVLYWTRAAKAMLNREGAQPRQAQIEATKSYDAPIEDWFRQFLAHWIGR